METHLLTLSKSSIKTPNDKKLTQDPNKMIKSFMTQIMIFEIDLFGKV